ncbi:MAG TPA: N-acetylmuramoyl-L-alanine amidase [Actinomycetota bacterium]|nr:N-acetylmuramoyl-L-alanine amidase [Actinomycetota bacterium]
MRTIKRGDWGQDVRDVQSRLVALGFRLEAAELEAHRFDGSTEAAVRTFQQERGLLVDASIGPITWQELVEAGYALGDRVLYLRYPYFRGDDVRALQRRLNVLGFDPGREDGIFGDQTSLAVRDFQQNVGLASDGIVGATTLDALDRLRPPVPGPGRTSIRESESLRSPTSLAGRRVALDVGHGPDDPGAVGPTGLSEAESAYQLAARLAAELRTHGAEPVLLRTPHENLPAAERVGRARSSNADALLSLHLNSHEDASAEGSSSYYFGRLGSVSVPGKALAELIQEELSDWTGVRDGRTHPMSFPLLRETPMPAVQVEPCFITNPKEEQLLTEERFRSEVARALVRALERFFGERS